MKGGMKGKQQVTTRRRSERSQTLMTLEGMVIGGVNGIIITDDTPLDPDQWENGKPWHIKDLSNQPTHPTGCWSADTPHGRGRTSPISGSEADIST